jgi:hypothetical protein
MAWDRWIGVAFVGLLALIAQPAAVSTATVDVASQTDEPGEPRCSSLDERAPSVTDELAGAGVVPERPDACVDVEEDIVDETVDDLADEPVLD